MVTMELTEMECDAQLIGVAVECPLHNGRDLECPFAELHLLTGPDKLHWLEGLSYEQKHQLCFKHIECFYKNR